jgi:DNA-directed RNA polymerase beta subunit
MDLPDLYFLTQNQVLVSHHIESYELFVEELIQKIVGGENVFDFRDHPDDKNKIVKNMFKFSNIAMSFPYTVDLDGHSGKKVRRLMYPMDAREKNLSYSGELTATVEQIQEISDTRSNFIERKIVDKQDKVVITMLPVMIKSKYCILSHDKETALK